MFVQVNFIYTCLPPNGDGLAVVVDLPALLTLRPHEVDQGVQKHLNPGNHLLPTILSNSLFSDMRVKLALNVLHS